MNDTPLQTVGQLEEALSRAGLDPVSHREALDGVRSHLTRYAGLEKKLLGHVWISYPQHLLSGDLPDTPLQAADTLAAMERDRLQLGDTRDETVMSLLDREGIKVYRPSFPEGSDLEGVFLFDPEFGPALLVSDSLTEEASDFVFARLYAHYLMDTDPYEIRLAFRGEKLSESVVMRARAFAAGFLIGRNALDRYLEAVGWSPGTAPGPDVLEQLEVYFGVAPETLVTRLLGLNYVEANDVASMLASRSSRTPLAGPAEPMSSVAGRFVRLALEAEARKVITLQVLSEYLETDTDSARRLAARFRLEEPKKPGHS